MSKKYTGSQQLARKEVEVTRYSMADADGCLEKFDSFYQFVETKIGNVFSAYGRFVATCPWVLIMACVLINGLLGIGMLRMVSEINAELSYTPTESQATVDREKVRQLFPDASGYNYNGFQLADLPVDVNVIIVSEENLLKREPLVDLQRLYSFMTKIKAHTEMGDPILYEAICARVAQECSVYGKVFFTQEFLAAVEANQLTYPYFKTNNSGIERYGPDVADIVLNGTYLESAKLLKFALNFRTDGPQYKPSAEKWMKTFLDEIETFQSPYFVVTYSTSISLDVELAKNVTGDVVLFLVTFGLMMIYACVATMTAKCNCVGQRMNLGYPGVMAACLAILGSFGLCSGLGVVFVNIVGVVPFLVIGIGIDDMFILMAGLAAAQGKGDVEEKMAETMRTSGVAITITSLTDLLAFVAGSTSSFLGVRNFCIYTGVAIIFCYLNNVTFFAACIAINERRVAEHGHCLTCQPVRSEEELKAEGKSTTTVLCCSGSPPASRRESESYLDRLPRWLFPKIVLKTPFKIAILFLFAGYLGVSVYGLFNLKQGIQLTNLVSDTSYFYQYAKLLEVSFPALIPISFVIQAPYQYSLPDTQDKIYALLRNSKMDRDIQPVWDVNWLSEYTLSSYYNDSTEEAFIHNLQTKFLTDPRFARYENDVVIDSNNATILASRVYAISIDVKDSYAQGAMMLRLRKIADDSDLSVFAYNPAFIYMEQFVRILEQTIQSVGIAVAAVFVITCIFMPHPLLIIYVTTAVMMIMVGILGFLPFIGLTLSSITMIDIIMSIGFSIDFTAHICHGYMISKGSSRNERVREAITIAGAPIFHGAFSSICGICVLASAKSYIFRAFFKVMVLVILFGICHALLLLPVVLSLIGPRKPSLAIGQSAVADIAGQSYRQGDEGSPEEIQEMCDLRDDIDSNTVVVTYK